MREPHPLHAMFVSPVRPEKNADKQIVHVFTILQYGGGEISLQYPSPTEAAEARSQLLLSENAHPTPYKLMKVLSGEFDRITMKDTPSARSRSLPSTPPN